MNWFALLPFSLAFTLLAYVLAPVLPLFAVQEYRAKELPESWKQYWLPWWLSWFQTPDNNLYGDKGHYERWGYSGSYWQMVSWLWRNPAYGFEWDGPLAAHIYKTDEIFTHGNPWIKNRANSLAGYYFCRIGDFWNYKVIKPLFGDLCFMAEFGWKLQGFAQGRETEGNAQYVFSIRLTAFNP